MFKTELVKDIKNLVTNGSILSCDQEIMFLALQNHVYKQTKIQKHNEVETAHT